MPRRQRVNFSLDSEVLAAFEDEVPRGDRSARVEELLREAYVDE